MSQRHCWPYSTLNFSRTRVQDLRDTILDARNGFTRDQGPGAHHSPPVHDPESDPLSVMINSPRQITDSAIDCGPNQHLDPCQSESDPLNITRTPVLSTSDSSESFDHTNRDTVNVNPAVWIHLFLDDLRFSPSRKSAADIPVSAESILTEGHCQLVAARDIFAWLQNSPSAINGTTPFDYHRCEAI